MLDCTRKNWWLRGLSERLRTARIRGRLQRPAETAGTKKRRRTSRDPGPAVFGELLEVRTLLTTITIDYSLDTNNFFDSQEKMDLLQSAADSLASRLTDSLAAIEPGPSGFGFDNTWTADFNHPGTGSPQSITDLTIAADTLVVYAGGRDLAGSTVGFGGPGGYSSSGTQAFLDLVASRGQSGALDSPATDFGPWGGAITFDTGTNWFFGTTTAGLDGDETDFLSVAEHELAHLLGLVTADSWDTYVSGSSFTGTASVAEYGSNVPLNGDAAHWARDTMSDGRDATMTPTLLNGTRGLFTSLDYAALDDIGWDLAAPVDYGDAPDTGAGTGAGNYQTLASDSGPSHTIVSGLFLGATVDGEAGTLQNSGASADDTAGGLPSDEDGVLDPLDLQGTEGAAPTITLLVTNTTGSAATLSGWIDFNGDGVFDNSSERTQVAVPNGTDADRLTLTFPVIPGGSAGSTYARFRLSTDSAGQNSTGAASDGEVEDYAFVITSPGSGTVDSFLEIASDTNGGPSLNTTDVFGRSLTAIGDLDGDGIPDMAVGASGDSSGRGAVHVLLMNSNGTVKSSTKIGSGVNGGPSLPTGGQFGFSVASLGDLDGDGVSDLAVGANRDSSRRGAVYVLLMNADGTVKDSTKIASDTNGGPTLTAGDYFGSSVVGIGDLDGDGVNDLAVGASGNGYYDGAVHVLFLNSDGTVKSSTEISNGTGGGPAVSHYDAFGNSVAGLGDLDGDGVIDLAVGSPKEYDSGEDRGSTYVLFLNADGTAKSSTKIANGLNGGPAIAEYDQFGTSVAGVGDLDADGVGDLAVGAIGDTTGGAVLSHRGAVHLLFLNSDGTVKDSTKIASDTGGGPTLANFDLFGWSVTGLGDLNGDGINDLAASSPGPGAVHVLFMAGPAGPQDESVTLSAGGSYEVLWDGDDLVVRVSGGAELFRQTASAVASLTINGSADADLVTVLHTGTAVDTPLVFVGGDGDDSFDASLATGPVNLSGNSGSDTLTGGSGDDTLTGGSQADELIGGPGNDALNGSGGTGDTLDGGDGDDTLNGGSGNDLIRETFVGDATLTNSAMTGRGNDTVIDAERAFLTGGGAGQTIDVSAFFAEGLTSVTLDGAGGNDVLIGSNGSDVLIGGGGSDSLEGGDGDDRILGGSGADTLQGGTGNDLLKGLGGSGDQLSGGEGDDTINGGRGIDRLIETADTDFTLTNASLAGLGSDVVQAIEVAELNGGDSANTIDVSAFLGFRGYTLIRGNGGNDTLIGSDGTDVLNGGDGDDSLVGNEGNDLLNGDAGDDILLGKEGNDTLNGGDGNDGLSGFTGDDEINGERGYDIGLGGEGNDTLTGGNAVDTLIGGDGDDSITGDGGTDTLVGGTGNNDASMGDVISDATATIDEAFMLDPLPAWVDQV